jgi:hypothetical protein
MRRRRVQHLDPDDVRRPDLGHEPQLLEPVQLGFDTPPVVRVGPVGAQLLHVRQRDALRPVVDGLPLGPTGGGQSLVQVVEGGLRDGDR